MKIWKEEKRSCRGRKKKRNVPVCSDFSILILGFSLMDN
jgi:hypothetical protein